MVKISQSFPFAAENSCQMAMLEIFDYLNDVKLSITFFTSELVNYAKTPTRTYRTTIYATWTRQTF